jgi:hypothetical protein
VLSSRSSACATNSGALPVPRASFGDVFNSSI